MSFDSANVPQDVPLPASSLRISRLLICDDSPVERLALAHLLRQTGFDVDEAGDGKTGLEQLTHRPVDLLLLDLNMPDVDGFGVLSYIQEHRPGLPVILLSGMPVDQIQHKMKRLRTPELPPLLLKPVDPQQLLQMIDLQLSGDLPDWHDAEQAK